MIYRLWTQPASRSGSHRSSGCGWPTWSGRSPAPLMIGEHLPGTLATSGGFIGWGVRVADLLAATVVLLYLGNLTEEEMPTRKIVRLLALLLHRRGRRRGARDVLRQLQLHLAAGDDPAARAAARPTTSISWSTRASRRCRTSSVPPRPSPRPKAPFAYTNNWGNNVAMLLIWFVVAGWIRGSRKSKVYTALTLGCRDHSDHLLAEPGRLDRARDLAAVPGFPAGHARQAGPHRRNPGHRRARWPCSSR